MKINTYSFIKKMKYINQMLNNKKKRILKIIIKISEL